MQGLNARLGEDKIVVFTGKLENLLFAIAVNCYNACRYVTSKHVQIKYFSLRRLRSKVVGVASETGVGRGIL